MPTQQETRAVSDIDAQKARALADMLEDFDVRVRTALRQQPSDRRWRRIFETAAARVDRAKLRALQAFIRDDSDRLMGMPAFKYLDIPFYLLNKARWVAELDLDRRPPERILDLGVGAGHFPFLAAAYGHQVVGIDMDNDVYARLLELYGIPRLVQMIVPPAALPDCGRFDLITSLQTTFNRPVGRGRVGRTGVYWTLAEWAWFFEQLCARLSYPGRIFFELNQQPWPDTGADHAQELMDLFARNGATVDRRRFTVLFQLGMPLTLDT